MRPQAVAGCLRADPLVGLGFLAAEVRQGEADKGGALGAAAVAADPQVAVLRAGLVDPGKVEEVATPLGALLTSSRSCT